MTVSPCKGCKNELEDKNKHPDCQVCKLPMEYVDRIGKCPSSSMELEVKKMSDEKAPESSQTKTITPEKDQLLEDHIKTLCEDHGMTIEQIRAGIQGAQDPDRRQLFHDIRDRIIKSLVSDEFGKLTQVEIGKILCASGATIANRMQFMDIAPANPRGKHKKNSKINKPKAATPAKPTNQLIIDFSDHQETLEKIRKAAKDLMREPEAQILFWLVHCDFEKLEGIG